MARLMPDLAEDTPLTRDEVGLLCGGSDDGPEEGMAVFLAEERAGAVVRQMTDPESGECVYHLGDVERLVGRRRRERPAKAKRSARPSDPAPVTIRFSDDPDLDAILLSDSGTAAYSVAKVAKAVGLNEHELHRRLRANGAKVEYADGKLLAVKGDVDRLMRQGTIPTPSKGGADVPLDQRVAGAAAALGIDMETGKPAAEEERPPASRSEPADPFARPTDPAVEQRTNSVADALGVELGSKPEPTQQTDATTTIIGKTHKRRRLGQPRRWSER